MVDGKLNIKEMDPDKIANVIKCSIYKEQMIITTTGESVLYDCVTDTYYHLSDRPITYEERETLYRDEFSRRLDRMMTYRGVTNTEMADELSVNVRTVTRYRQGKVLPNTYMVWVMSMMLDCTVEYLTDFEYYD